MTRPKPPQQKKTTRAKPNHRADGTFKVSKRGKYNNQGRREDGHWFHSGAEADRYLQLKLLAKAGVLTQLKLQPSFSIQIKGVQICVYKADFSYKWTTPAGQTVHVIEDVKGMETDVFKLKKKMAEAMHSVHICLVPARKLERWAGLNGYEVEQLVSELKRKKK